MFKPINKKEIKPYIYEMHGFRVILVKDIVICFDVALTNKEVSLFQIGIAIQTKLIKGGCSNNPTVLRQRCRRN